MRNPVTDIPVMTAISDITEWGYAVNGLPFDMASPPTATLADAEVFKRLRASSPMEHVEKVVAPTLMILGSGDRRVPPSQGITWWQARQNKIKKDQQKDAVNRIQMFDGTGHALDSVEAESNNIYSLGSFFVEFTRVKRKGGILGMEKATLRKATVSTLPLWIESEQDHGRSSSSVLVNVPEEEGGGSEHERDPSTVASSSKKLTPPNLFSIPSYSRGSGGHQQDWSVFATMSNVSTISERVCSPRGTLTSSSNGMRNAGVSSKFHALKLDELFKITTTATITTTTAAIAASITITITTTTTVLVIAQSTDEQETLRGYPTGQCASTSPPEHTSWDEKEDDEEGGLPLALTQSTAKNTAFNLEVMKAFLNSPLFSNFLKSLTIMAAVSLFAIALNAIVILLKTSDQQTQLSNDNAALIVIVILSLLTILYSCFTIFLESRRPPEGLDTSNSKPLRVIFSEIIASIIWAQMLSVTIYIYIWTYGCTAAGQNQLEQHWELNMADQRLTEMLCRRQGAMVGLELLLVLLLIFNFYTHLAQNFKFIRAVS
ncbi:hypothetical protein BGZ65_003999 [Modicella reniformis]|uniref:Dipeptidyl-peptidase V n=1 Tax=Modicella reniformis TaxID=1440133 RepID=A0A9P6SMA9_9FUNG|nr:hypothetical protein BGZ65_003999 [Modicella reniformis]